MAFGGEHKGSTGRTAALRVAIGFLAGLAIWLLKEAADQKVWPATQGPVFGLLAAVALGTPFVLLGGLADMRRRPLLAWTGAVTATLAFLGAYDFWRRGTGTGALWLSPEMMLMTAAALFVAHNLVEAADDDSRPIARYPTYFDLAWKHGVQLAASAAFVGVFWLVMNLGAELFRLIGIDFLRRLIEKDWFVIPASGAMFAAAVQLTDVRHTLIRGIRTVALTLLAWLMPVLVALAAAFLASLPFTGLEPLWKTRSAAAILLGAGAILVLLVNAAYQDGAADDPPPAVLRWAARLGGLLLLPLVALGAYALCLRIGQYGLTPERIIAASVATVGAVYAVGYAAAAVVPGLWMKLLELTNVVAAFVAVALLLALNSPVADPARLSVADQMARIEAGKVAADRVDYVFLRFEGERWGMAALKTLKSKGGEIGKRAGDVLAMKARPSPAGGRGRSEMIEAEAVAWATGSAPPPGFVGGKWPRQAISSFRCQPKNPCTGLTRDLNGDGRLEVLLMSQGETELFEQAGETGWRVAGQYRTAWCSGVEKAFKEGKVVTKPPAWPDLELAGRRVTLDATRTNCDGDRPARPPVVD
ncbi:MAG: DUF4153 domain-containing protein [Pseudomonadota bacterium]